ncbi:MAG: hypothetical protein CM1200mP40_02500 [Gammaproteobacteria bacterium]|nr:MAG: hypothetical protein CM1200mP40_02500 [Gammaproteobacteria bacterium]
MLTYQCAPFPPVLNKTGLLAQMPGSSNELKHYGIKLLSLHSANTTKALPAIQGLVVMFEAETGIPVAILEAAQITAIRTAAASGLATQLLSREDAKTWGIFGNGVQAVSHIEAIKAVRPIEKVVVWGRNAEKTEGLQKSNKSQLIAKLLPQATQLKQPNVIFVCTVTASKESILNGSWVKPGATLILLVHFPFNSREADSELVPNR